MTNILDPEQAPALELAALYHERWEIEGVFDEFKTHLRANSTVLRSKTPDLGRCVSSRGRFNRRGVKRKMSNFHVRHRGDALHRRHQPQPVLRV